jgi:hypothetical protein
MVKLKLIFFLVILYFFHYGAATGQKLRYGVQLSGGIASAYQYYPKKNEYTNNPDFGMPKNIPILSYGFNLYASYELNEQLGIAFEPGFIRKGFANKFVDSYDLTHNKTYLSYIQLPVLMEFKLADFMTLTIGPEIGYLIDAKLKQIDALESVSIMNYYQHNRIDVGLQGGAYYSLSDNFDVGLKAAASLTNLERFYIEVEGGNALVEVRRNSMYIHAFTRVKF